MSNSVIKRKNQTMIILNVGLNKEIKITYDYQPEKQRKNTYAEGGVQSDRKDTK